PRRPQTQFIDCHFTYLSPLPDNPPPDVATTDIYTLSLHDALPILFSKKEDHLADTPSRLLHEQSPSNSDHACESVQILLERSHRSEEHTSELQSRENHVCRLLLEKKKEIDVRVPHKLCKRHWYVGG